MARLARSLLAHGKAREAKLWQRRAEAAGDAPEARHARLLLELVATREDRDPEIPLAPDEGLEPPIVPGLPGAGHPDLVASEAEYPEVIAHYRERKYASAYKILEDWPEDLGPGSARTSRC